MRSFEAAPLGSDEADPLFAPLAAAEAVVAAVSGGPDSTALAGLLARWAVGQGRAAPIAATVDHGLRPDSRAEAEAAGAFCRGLGLDHRILAWDGPKPAAGLQEAARNARYALLLEFARRRGASHLVTAHTADDQAETILMRLAAGSGIGGLAGMTTSAERDGVVHLRPFLAVSKARLVATCRANGWPFVEDPSNRDPRFARTRLRRIGPLLTAEGLTPERLARLGERAARAEAALLHAARRALREARPEGGPGDPLDASRLFAEPFEIVLRALALFIDEAHARHEMPARRHRLERLEVFTTGLTAAAEDGASARHNFAGLLFTLRKGHLAAAPEPARRRAGTGKH